MAMSMSQVRAMQGMGGGMGGGGAAALVSSITGPLAAAGTDVTRSIFDAKQNKRELKQRQREMEALIPVYERQQRQSALDTVAAVRQQQIVSGYQAAYAPYLLMAVAIGSLALIAISASKGGK